MGRNSLASDANLQLIAELGDDFVRRQNAGENPTVDQYVALHPDLAQEIRNFFDAINIVKALNRDSLGSIL